MLNQDDHRIIEQEIESAVDSRNEALPTLRELGPPDLVHLVKQSSKSGNKQVSSLLTSRKIPRLILLGRAGFITMSQE